MSRVFTRSDLLQQQIFEVKLPVTHWKVLFAVDGTRDADSLSTFLGLPATDVNRALENLAERQLLNALDAGVEEKTKAQEEAVEEREADRETAETENAFQPESEQKVEDEANPAETEPDVLEFPAAEEEETLEIEEEGDSEKETAAAEAAEAPDSSADEEFDQLIGQLLEEPEEEAGAEAGLEDEKVAAGEEEKSEEAAPESAAVSEEETKAEGEEDFDFGSLFQEDMAETEQTLTDLMENLEEETEAEVAGAEVEAPAPEVRHTLLVVDDSVVIRKMVEIALENENYEIVSVANGKDALKFLDENTPSLVILDIMLPDVNGLDILKAIKASKDIPVVMLSAKDTPRETTKAKELGADDFIPKPFKDEELVSKIRELIGA